MAKKRLKIKDKHGNVVDFDISASSITIDSDGKSVEVKLTELFNAIAERIKSVTFNGSEKNPDKQGKISISQEQSSWNESNPKNPAYIQGKPDSVVNEISYDQQSRKVKQRRNGVVEDVFTLPEGGSQVTFDEQMSSTSENGVQNKVIKAYVDAVSQRIDTLIGSGNVQGAIDTFNEVKAFLNGIDMSDPTLANQLLALNNAISAVQTSLAAKANSADVYTKTEVDDKVANAGKVKSVSVNGGTPSQPDAQGNVNVSVAAGAQGQKGDKGDTVVVGGEQEFTIVNDTTTGGASDALSAEMGKRVAGRVATDRQRIDAIVGILKKSVFTDDQTAAFDRLDALANGIDSISFNASSHKFTGIGDTFTLSVVTDPAGKTAQISSWSSSNTSVATVNNGVVTSVADGDAVITATTSDGKTATCKIKVETIVITGVSLNKSTLTLNGNDANETLVATTTPTGYESGVQWSSSDPTKATIDNNGKVTAVGNGSTIITASIGGQSATCQVTVTGVMQTFHIGVGTLSNVTIEDGQGNAITDDQTVLEDSALTINFVPAASHEISALSVVMGSTTLSLADATDGTDGTKVISIQIVSGDITVSASATYVRTNLISNATKLTKQGVIYASSGRFNANNDYDCFIVPLEFGKRYEVDGYDWKAKNGVSGGFNIALVKSDGNGGFTNINSDTDIADSAAFKTANTMFDTDSSRVYHGFSSSDYRERFFVTIPPASVFDQSVDAVYLAINTRFSNVDISNDIRMYEYLLGSEYSADGIIQNYGLIFDSYSIGYDTHYSVSIVKATKGASYSYSGLKWSELGGNGDGFCVALLKKTGDTEMIANLKAGDFNNGSSWLQSDSYFKHTNNICKKNPAEAATITIPTSADLANDTDLYIAITTRFTSTDISSYITLTKQ